VLEKTVSKAEEMSAQGASAEKVVSEIESSLERNLGRAAKDAIVSRASSILALARVSTGCHTGAVDKGIDLKKKGR
jgi:hypothetical protein